IINHLPAVGVIEDWPAHALGRFLGSVRVLRRILREGLHLPKRGLVATALPVAGGTFLNRIETTLMLPVIVSPRNGKSGFGPDNLTPEFESGSLQRLLNLTAKQARMPTIGDISRKERIGVGPIDPIVVLDFPFATGGKRDFSCFRRFVPPRGGLVDAIGWVGDHQTRPSRAFGQKPIHPTALSVASPHKSRW